MCYLVVSYVVRCVLFSRVHRFLFPPLLPALIFCSLQKADKYWGGRWCSIKRPHLIRTARFCALPDLRLAPRIPNRCTYPGPWLGGSTCEEILSIPFCPAAPLNKIILSRSSFLLHPHELDGSNGRRVWVGQNKELRHVFTTKVLLRRTQNTRSSTRSGAHCMSLCCCIQPLPR